MSEHHHVVHKDGVLDLSRVNEAFDEAGAQNRTAQ